MSVTPAAVEVRVIVPPPVLAMVSVLASAPSFRVISPLAVKVMLPELVVTRLVVATSIVPALAVSPVVPAAVTLPSISIDLPDSVIVDPVAVTPVSMFNTSPEARVTPADAAVTA